MTIATLWQRSFAMFSHPRFLAIYSGFLTLVLAVSMLTGFAWPSKKASFEELDVQRINLREPDGTVRLIMSSNARFPGALMFGQEYPHEKRKEDHTAGMIFFDGEGSESGGLIFGGQKNADGATHRFGHLSFDKYNQDQVMALEGLDADGKHSSTIVFNDQPDWALSELLALERAWQRLPKAEREAAEAEFVKAHGHGHRRALLGRRDDASSVLDLRDAQGRTRLIARVSAEGTPTLQVLDEQGQVTEQWPSVKR
ncbi:MAG TPA: hypothetical protein VF928_07610 [Usitatibacteraceae bacterium]